MLQLGSGMKRKEDSKGPEQQISVQTTRSSTKASKPKTRSSTKASKGHQQQIPVRKTPSSKVASRRPKQQISCKSSRDVRKARAKARKPAARGTVPPHDSAPNPIGVRSARAKCTCCQSTARYTLWFSVASSNDALIYIIHHILLALNVTLR